MFLIVSTVFQEFCLSLSPALSLSLPLSFTLCCLLVLSFVRLMVPRFYSFSLAKFSSSCTLHDCQKTHCWKEKFLFKRQIYRIRIRNSFAAHWNSKRECFLYANRIDSIICPKIVRSWSRLNFQCRREINVYDIGVRQVETGTVTSCQLYRNS